MHKIKIEVAGTYFTVHPLNPLTKELVELFKELFLTYSLVKKNNRFFKEVDREFYASLKVRNKYTFIREALPVFVEKMKECNITRNDIDIVVIPDFPVRTIDLEPHPVYEPRGKQTLYVDAMVNTEEAFTLTNAPTGSGKTIMACLALQRINKATLIIVKPAYIEKWISDIMDATTATRDELLVIKNTKHLIETMEAVDSGDINPPFILISNRLLILYIKEYENAIMDKMFKHPYTPYEIAEKLAIGVTLVDEIHEEFFSIFKILMYLNVKKNLGLSATLETNDEDIRKMQYLLFPSKNRLKFLTDSKYIDVTAIDYPIRNKDGVKFDAPGDRGYSHVVLEQSIMRNKQWLANYLKMIVFLTSVYYFRHKKDNDKLIIFASTIDMCNIITRTLKKHYKQLDVRKYTAGDPYENVIEPDIRISTVGKAGTAIDIPGLTTVIQTINILSIVSNVQTIGRLRDIPGKKLNFVYLFSSSIKKHKEYHYKRQSMLKRKAKSYKVVDYLGYVK